MYSIDYYIVDVFTTEKYGGNQLGVFIDFENKLSDTDMLQIARELGFSEVTFIKNNYKNKEFEVRIFTPEYEVPFAGHPTLGTAFVISKYLIPEPRKSIILKLKHGNINVSIDNLKRIDHAKFSMQQAQPEFIGKFDPKNFAHDTGIDLSILDTKNPIEEISTGLPYIIVPVTSLDALDNLSLNYDLIVNFLISNNRYKTNSTTGLTTSFFFVTEDTYEIQNDYNTRMFCIENKQIIEDAATGSANGCFLAYLLKNKSDIISCTVEQGFQMHRRSYIYLDGEIEGDNFDINISGNVVEISKGQWKY